MKVDPGNLCDTEVGCYWSSTPLLIDK